MRTVCSNVEAAQRKLAFQEQLLLNYMPVETLDPIRNLWVCVCASMWERARKHVSSVCHHKLIIFLLSHRSATCHHLTQQVYVCALALLCFFCFQSPLSSHRKHPETTGCKIRWALGHMPLAIRSVTVSSFEGTVALNLLADHTLKLTNSHWFV